MVTTVTTRSHRRAGALGGLVPKCSPGGQHWPVRRRLGVSGSTELEQRLSFVQAVGALRTHKAGLLVITRRDRLARDPAVAALIERAVAQQGARIVSADGLANSDSAADNFLKTILNGAAAYERALIRARTKDALKTKRGMGYRAGTFVVGDKEVLVPWGTETKATSETTKYLR